MIVETVRPFQWATFFEALEMAYTVSTALKRANISRATAYRQKKDFPWIAEKWEHALQAGRDYLEDAARTRAVDGIPKVEVIFDRNGNVIAERTEIVYSDTLLKTMLTARVPEYRKALDINPSREKPLHELTDDELLAIATTEEDSGQRVIDASESPNVARDVYDVHEE